MGSKWIHTWLLSSIGAFLLGAIIIAGSISYIIQRDHRSTLGIWRSRLFASVLFRAWTLRVSLQESEDDSRLLADFEPTSDLLASPKDRDARARVTKQFHSYRKIFGYSAVYLLDREGHTVIADADTPLWSNVLRSPAFLQSFRAAKSSKRYVVNIIGTTGTELALLFATPVSAVNAASRSTVRIGSPTGFLAILSPLSRELGPLLLAQSEPTRTGETLLVQLEESGARYISARRLGSAASERRSSDQLLQASRSAVEDRVSFGQFDDYRGVEVMAGMQRIPEIRCVLASKIDTLEALADFRRTAFLHATLGGAALLFYAGLIMLHKRNAKARDMKLNLARQKIENQTLETVVAERTSQLASMNDRLRQELRERQRVEEQIRGLNANLEERVRDRTASLEAANAELEAFSYSVSHDLRAPLRAANGYAAILWEDYMPQLPERARQCLQTIRNKTTLMAQLIDALLALSRLGRQELRKRQFAPADLAREAWSELRSESDGRHVELLIGDLPSCEADPILLKQVFTNLLSNALKYSRKKEIAKIEVGSFGSAYYVRDNGAGFDMQYADQLFGAFQRLHRVEEFEGIGIGLANVRRIINRHGGQVWAESAVDNGATFFFTLSRSILSEYGLSSEI
jgi:signal transduction histidine kinase